MAAFPYAVVYRVTLDAVGVHIIAHAKRRPTCWPGRRFEEDSEDSPTCGGAGAHRGRDLRALTT